MSQQLLLKPRSVETTTGNGEAKNVLSVPAAAYCLLEIHDTSTGTLQAKVETKIGDQWRDVMAFSSQLAGPARQLIMKQAADVDQPEQDDFPAGGNVDQFLGGEYRARWLIAGGTVDFSMTLHLEAR